MAATADHTYRTEGPRLERFSQKFIRQTKGRWAGQPLVYEPWEKKFLRELLLRRADNERVYRQALLGVARKNGKSTLSASIALYMLMGTREHSPEVYAAAASKDQARVVFDQARDFVETSPLLSQFLEPQRSAIICKSNKGIFRVLASDGPLQHGLNPYGVIIDELWAHKNPELYYALTTGQGARLNPLVVSITTAGWDRESICYDRYKYGKKLMAGGLAAMRENRFLFKWYEPPPKADYLDKATWHYANPSSWITEDDLELASKSLPESVFRRLHLNQWTESEEAWIKPHQWDACAGRPKLDFGKEIIAMAVDVGVRRDCAAIVWGQWHGDVLHIDYMILDPQKIHNFQVADIRGHFGITARRFASLREGAYDPWQFRESAEILQEGLHMEEFPQNDSRMGPASETLYELVKEQRICHDGGDEAREHVLRTVTQPTARGGWKISKKKSGDRIDFTVALAMVADRAVTLRYVKPSVYDSRGILSYPLPQRPRPPRTIDGEEV